MFKRPLNELMNYLGSKPIDAFICCASFEKRSTSIAEHLDPGSVGGSWIAYHQDFLVSSQENLDTIKSRFTNQHSLLELNTTDPLITADCIASNLSNLCVNSQRILIDITSFTRESLLILVKFLTDNLCPENSVEFIYANASEYSIGNPSDEKWLSKGNREIRSILGYPGTLIPSKQNHLIVLLGFEDERSLSLIRECEPSRISLGISDRTEQASIPHQDTNEARLRRLKSVIGSVNEFTFAGYDARDTKVTIQQLISNATDYNTIIAPMNTKISTLGAAMVALKNKSIQICYAQAELYNIEKYSNPGQHFFSFSLADIFYG